MRSLLGLGLVLSPLISVPAEGQSVETNAQFAQGAPGKVQCLFESGVRVMDGPCPTGSEEIGCFDQLGKLHYANAPECLGENKKAREGNEISEKSKDRHQGPGEVAGSRTGAETSFDLGGLIVAGLVIYLLTRPLRSRKKGKNSVKTKTGKAFFGRRDVGLSKTTIEHDDRLENWRRRLETVWKGAARSVEFTYLSKGGKSTRRKVDITKIYLDPETQSYYLEGYCHLRQDTRIFDSYDIETKILEKSRRYDIDDWIDRLVS